jgi:ATP-dependent DNA ligase
VASRGEVRRLSHPDPQGRQGRRAFSKNGNDFTTRFPDITHAIAALASTSFILDAELTACSHDGSPDFSALLSKKGSDLCVWVFDILAQHGRDLRAFPHVTHGGPDNARRW